jgi:TrmH family RNA methyltransferase
MLSKTQLSFLRSLHQKKFRQTYGKFLVEGDKLVRELLTSQFKVDAIYKIPNANYEIRNRGVEVFEVTQDELSRISTHETPNQVIAVAQMPATDIEHQTTVIQNELVIVCDNLSDPGNAGTIIRTADWFGITKVFFSLSSVDIYNPKVVSSAKGSLFRTQCFYTDLKELFETNKHLNVYGTFMNGESVYTSALDKNAFILIGNEANGISHELLPFITDRISIPQFGKAESLNAAVAAGIVMGEFRRKN